MGSCGIPANVREDVVRIIEQFNRKLPAHYNCIYSARFRGCFLYLDRDDDGVVGPICRLQYNGDMKNWSFAIYKFSSDRYDPNETWFPGYHLVDGTVEGAMKAGMEAYT